MSRCFRNDLEGVYIVIGKTIEGNYKLTTADGEELKYSVPPYKLKPLTTEPENPSVEVERILNKRTNSNNENEYLVTFRSYHLLRSRVKDIRVWSMSTIYYNYILYSKF